MNRITLCSSLCLCWSAFGCGASTEADGAPSHTAGERSTAPADAAPATTTEPGPVAAPPPADRTASAPPAPEAPAAPRPPLAPPTVDEHGVTQIEVYKWDPFDFGPGFHFDWGPSDEPSVVTVNGEVVPEQQVQHDYSIGLYLARGMCWAVDGGLPWDKTATTYRVYYREAKGKATDLEQCKKVLRYEMPAPFAGQAIDPAVFFECQHFPHSCETPLPENQLRCRNEADCGSYMPDGMCCNGLKFVSYNKRFGRRLTAHQQRVCRGVRCSAVEKKWARHPAHCIDGLCSAYEPSNEDPIEPIDL